MNLLLINSENTAFNAISQPGHFVPSSTVSSTLEGCTSAQNVCFDDDETQHTVSIPTSLDSGYAKGSVSDASLGDFLSRPQQIHQFTWDVNNDFHSAIDPWRLFLEDPAITQKISNYNLLRCDLKVKIVINGNAFYYGDLLASYRPHPDGFTLSSLYDDYLIYQTQRPHVILSPTMSSGGTLSLPYFQPYNWYSVPQASWRNVGTLDFDSFMSLRNANAATAAVTVTVFAWAENVEMSIPTTALPASDVPFEKVTKTDLKSYVPSSTENPSVISDTATAISNVAASAAPFLGAPATTVSKIAGGIGKFAKALGFDRVNDLTTHTVVENRFLSNTASTTIAEHVSKLTLDPHQELSVSSACVGINEPDKLLLADQAAHPALLFQFPWQSSQAAGSQIAAIRVNPAASTITASTTVGRNEKGRIINMTPLCHVSQPFSYWTGSIKYKFVVMASTFHKGRIKVVWDPNPNLDGVSTPSTNTVYSRIIDLSQTKEFTIDVAWGQPKPYLSVSNVVVDTRNNASGNPNLMYHVGNNSGTTATTYDPKTDNGMLYVYVLNELVTPNNMGVGNPIVNVYTYSDDIQFNVPTTDVLEKVAFFPAPGDFYPASTYVDTLDPDTENSIDTVGGSLPTDELRTFFGEAPISFRSLLKRSYGLRSYFGHTNTTSADYEQVLVAATARMCVFPPYPGFDPTGPDFHIIDGISHNYSKPSCTLLNWIAPLFCAMRGGFRVKSVSSLNHGGFDSNTDAAQYNYSVERTNPHLPNTDYRNISLTSINFSDAFSYITEKAFEGFMLTPGRNQPVLEVEVPFYNNRRFNDPRKLQTNDGTPADEGGYYYVFCKSSAAFSSKGTTDASFYNLNYGSTGPDFSLYWRINTVPIWDNLYQIS